MLQIVSKVAPRSPLNIGWVKSDGIIRPPNCVEKSSEMHIVSPKHNNEFRSFVLKFKNFEYLQLKNFKIKNF